MADEPDAPIVRTCRSCSARFIITVDEQLLFRRLAVEKGGEWRLPNRCDACRMERRRSRYSQPVDDDGTDVCLTCVLCGKSFIFGGRDREYFAKQGYATPKRCRPCRRVRAQTNLGTRAQEHNR